MNAFVLKIVAMLTMLADHIGEIFMGDAISMRIVGRIAFPLYSFMVVDGCRHVMKKRKQNKKVFDFSRYSCRGFGAVL